MSVHAHVRCTPARSSFRVGNLFYFIFKELSFFPTGQLFCIFPPGGGVPVPPLPIHWYYIMAAGGALLLLAVAILVRALCCCRQHLATKKSQLSVAYHSSSQCFQYANWSTSMATPGVEPVLTVRLDSRDRHRTLC